MAAYVETTNSASDFVGTFHSLWLYELATGRSRKLCDYLGVASAAWSSDDVLLVTQYAGKRTSPGIGLSRSRRTRRHHARQRYSDPPAAHGSPAAAS